MPLIEVFNKVDALTAPLLLTEADVVQATLRVAVSAQTGEGIAALKEAIVASLSVGRIHCQLRLPHAEGAVRAALYREHSVISEQVLDTGEWLLAIQIQRHSLLDIFTQAGLDLEEFIVQSS